MTRRELPARVANIQRAIASPATCSTATVESLRDLLLDRQKSNDTPRSLSVKSSGGSRKTASQTKPAARRPKKQPVVAVLEIQDPDYDRIDGQDKVALATEVANTTLKSLSNAVKSQPVQTKRSPLRRTSSNFSSGGSGTPRSQTPLQQRCTNALGNRRGEKGNLRRCSSSNLLDEKASGLRAQAECGRIAFATLRLLRGQTKPHNLLDLQLESGMSALIGKLIALGLEDLAIKELRILKRRLESNPGALPTHHATNSSLHCSAPNVKGPERESLADLLRFGNITVEGQHLALITTTQLQVIKLLARIKEPTVLSKALEYLRLELSGSPADMIQRQIVSESSGCREKAALQLEALAQALLASCPGLSAADETKSITDLHSKNAFQVQFLALKMRMMWWKLIEHQVDVVKEAIEPFQRSVAALRRRFMTNKNLKYEDIKAAMNFVAEYAYSRNDIREETFAPIYYVMADLAHESALYTEAIHWLSRIKESMSKHQMSPVKACSLDCRLATLRLRVVDEDPSTALLGSLTTAAQSLSGNLQGESDELDELLINVTSLRRSAFSALQENHKQEDSKIIQQSTALYSDIVLVCLKFVLRYIGYQSTQNGSERVAKRQSQRRRLAAQVSKPIIESVAAIARFSAKSPPQDWKKYEAGLQDCSVLALAVEAAESVDPEAAKEGHISFMSISNAFWYRFLYLKQTRTEAKNARDCLRKSTDSLKGRPIEEKLAGLLPLKLEKYAQLCETLEDYREALRTYQESLQAQIDAGALVDARTTAGTRSLSEAFDCTDETKAMSRTLLAHCRAAEKSVAQGYRVDPFFDSVELCSEERGLLLEQQLIGTLSINLDHRPPTKGNETIQILAKHLLSIYTEDTFPVRRLRVIVRLSVLMFYTPNLLNDDELRNLLRKPHETHKKVHLDMGLLHFLPHLIACRKLLNELDRDTLEIEEVEYIVRTWSTMVCDHPNWNSLQMRIYDMSDWLSLLDSLADFLNMQGLELTRIAVLQLIVTVHEAASSKQSSLLVSKLSLLGLQYARLGLPSAADSALCKAQRFLDVSDVPIVTALEWQLCHAEYALCIGNVEDCGHSLSKARKLFDKGVASAEGQILRFRDYRKYSLLAADACDLRSRFAFTKGRSMKALYLARLSVKMVQKVWATVERDHRRGDKHDSTSNGTNNSDVLIETFSELSIHGSQMIKKKDTADVAPNGAAFWDLVPRLFRNLTNVSGILAYSGLFSEAKYYLSLAQKFADSTKAFYLKAQHGALLGQHLIAGGNVGEGIDKLQAAHKVLVNVPHDQYDAQIQISLAKHSAENGDQHTAEGYFVAAEQTLSNIMSFGFLGRSGHHEATLEAPEVALDSRMGALTLKEKKARRHVSTQAGPAKPDRKETAKPFAAHNVTTTLPPEAIAAEAGVFESTKNEILYGRIITAICEGKFELADVLLDKAEPLSCHQDGIILKALLTSKSRFCQFIGQVASNPVLCVLQESAISCPAITPNRGRQHQQKSKPARTQDGPRGAPGRAQRSKAIATKARISSPLRCKPQIDLLSFAQASLVEIHNLSKIYGKTSVVHEITNLLGKVLMMLSATSSHDSKLSVSTTFVAYILETGRLLAMTRESIALRVEQQVLQRKITLEWFDNDLCEEENRLERCHSTDFTNFQTDHIDIIPPTWTVVSLTLGASREELLICKMRAGQPPQVLRLPLSRLNALEQGNESFGFDEGKAELQEIIRLTNESTHSAQDFSQKGAKAKWWETRTALDARLKDLLINIESIWLGGFKGIFLQGAQNQGLLARLQQSLQNILDKHLPSRQTAGKKTQSNQLTFDPQIIELFVGLGNPCETNDIDEPLMDLLYFLIDILQFNGERNAYDEVDFDSIAIETTDALRQYHQANHGESANTTNQHTILVLDKHLHCFPWESLPCLRDLAVSRVPSLSCLRDRLLSQRHGNSQSFARSSTYESIRVDRNMGASILNPGGDLTATQEKFEEPLQELSDWETIIQREPTESEMQNLLENRELFLYFGHGSGSQYIRSRTIKKLERCAVALLMGCSSGVLTEAGDFESYGTPMNYMHAGSPAVLATLWDVTDKDIDKFSHTVLEKWGLFSKSQAPTTQSPVKRTGRKKVKTETNNDQDTEQGEGHASLDRAVSMGRDSCILKYLNGAAPVVYGVPVFLS